MQDSLNYIKDMDFEIIEDNSLKHIINIKNSEQSSIEVLKSDDQKVYYPLDGAFLSLSYLEKNSTQGMTLLDLQKELKDIEPYKNIHDFNCHLINTLGSCYDNDDLSDKTIELFPEQNDIKKICSNNEDFMYKHINKKIQRMRICNGMVVSEDIFPSFNLYNIGSENANFTFHKKMFRSFRGQFNNDKKYVNHDILLLPFFEENLLNDWHGEIHKEEIPDILNMEFIWHDIENLISQNFSWNENVSILEKKINFKKQFLEFQKNNETTLEHLFLMKDLLTDIIEQENPLKSVNEKDKKWEILRETLKGRTLEKIEKKIEILIKILENDYSMQLKLG